MDVKVLAKEQSVGYCLGKKARKRWQKSGKKQAISSIKGSRRKENIKRLQIVEEEAKNNKKRAKSDAKQSI